MLDAHMHMLSHPNTSKILMVAIIRKVYTEDTILICHHKGTQNSYKYKLLAPPSTRCIRNKNINSFPNSICHKL